MRMIHPPTKIIKKIFPFHCGFAPPASFIAYKAATTRKPNVGKRIVGADRSRILRKRGRVRVISVALLLCVLPGWALAEAKPPTQTQRYNIDIPALNAAEALNELAAQTGATFLFPYEQAKTRQANGVKGRFTLINALERLLAGSGLSSGLSEQGVLQISVVESEDNDNKRREAMKSKKSVLATVIGFLIGAGGTQGVVAQEQGGERSARVLDEIIVTAQKREQNVQDVPAAISAFGADALQRRGISSPQDLQYLAPGLTVGETAASAAQVTIRGVGTENALAGGDPGVPIHIDGHYLQFTSYALQDFFDVERVEVQRGPQGTLYGRNAVGGNINIITKRPTNDFEAELSVDLGNYTKQLFQGVVSGPLTDNLRGRIAISDQKRDGFIKNISTGDDLLDSDYTSLRASLEYELIDNVDVFLSGYRYRDKSSTFVNQLTGDYPQVGMYAGNDPGYKNISASDPGKVRADAPNAGSEDADGVSLDITWDLGGVILKSLSAYNDAEKSTMGDLDSTDLPSRPLNPGESSLDLPLREGVQVIGSNTLSQEFQLLSDDATDIKWILGLFYFEEESDFLLRITIPTTPVVFENPYNVETQSIAAFGQVDYSLTERLELTAGLRHTRDEKDMQRSIFFTFDGVNNLFVPERTRMEDSWEQTSGKLGLSYHATDDVLLYASYSLGFKAGGFNGSSVIEPSYEPELLDAYEVGIKGQFLDSRLQLNASAFYYDYTDKTESKVEGFVGVFTNAAAATITGLEFETQVYLTDSLLVDATLAYQKAEYDEFFSQDPSNAALGVQDLSGNQLTRTPEMKFHLGMQYEKPLSGNLGQLTARIDYSWVDEQYFRAFNLETDKADSYHRTNARLQWESGDTHWLAELYALNLEDDYVLSNLLVASPDFGFAHIGSYLPPRTYGIKVSYRF